MRRLFSPLLVIVPLLALLINAGCSHFPYEAAAQADSSLNKLDDRTLAQIAAAPSSEGAAKMDAAPAPTLMTPASQEQAFGSNPVLPGQPLPAAGNRRAAQGEAPLRFVFPTPGPEPVSAWRPPLYPVPWEPTPMDHFYFSRPIGADNVNWPLADYRYGGVFFGNEVHTGVDVPSPTGTSILAAGPGKVIWAGFGLYALLEDPSDPYGLAVAIRHDFGYNGETLYTVYGHMSEILVHKGQTVESGDLIGKVGETGNTTGPHLHFEVRVSKNNFFGSRNPELWLSPPQGWGVLAARVMDNRGSPLFEHTINVHSLDTGQYWEVKTYGDGSTNSDPYYRENMVMGDLPAGRYEIWIGYAEAIYDQKLEIKPGQVTYFTFKGQKGFIVGPPPEPGAGFSPQIAADTQVP